MSDNRYLNLGSMNNDRWSWNINNEVNIYIEDPREYDWASYYLDRKLATSRPVTKNYTLTASRAATINFWLNFLYIMEALMSKKRP